MTGEGPGKYARFQKFDRQTYVEVNDALKRRTHLTAREWAVARLCADFRAEDGTVPMTWIGEHLPELVPFMGAPYVRQDVASAEAAFRRKVARSGTTFFYAYYAGLISMDDMLESIREVVENIEALLKAEGGAGGGDANVEVQRMMAETLRRITKKLSGADEPDGPQ